MFQGIASKLSITTIASAASFRVRTDVIRLTGTVQVDNIYPAFGRQFAQMITIIPTSGAIVFSAAGNIAVGLTALQNRALTLFYDPSVDKWYLESGV